MPVGHRKPRVRRGGTGVGGEPAMPIFSDALLGSKLLQARSPLSPLQQVLVVLLPIAFSSGSFAKRVVPVRLEVADVRARGLLAAMCVVRIT